VPEPNTGAFLTNCPAQYRQQQLLDKREQG
jgi:hypothetical protein